MNSDTVDTVTDVGQCFMAAFAQLRHQYRFEIGEYGWKIHHDTPDGKKLTFEIHVNIRDRVGSTGEAK